MEQELARFLGLGSRASLSLTQLVNTNGKVIKTAVAAKIFFIQKSSPFFVMLLRRVFHNTFLLFLCFHLLSTLFQEKPQEKTGILRFFPHSPQSFQQSTCYSTVLSTVC